MPIFIPPKTRRRMEYLGLSEWIVKDTFNTGTLRPDQNKKYKRYDQYGYTVLVMFVHNDNGEDVIIYVDKW